MKKIILFLCLITLLFSSCVTLKPTNVTWNASIDNYKYVYITPTSEKTSVSGAVVGGKYGVYGATDSHSSNPADIISGHFIKRGYTRLPEIQSELIDKTCIVNFGEIACYSDGFYHYEEIIIQILSAKTNDIICVGSSEERGDTEAAALRKAIDRCMEEIFK